MARQEDFPGEPAGLDGAGGTEAAQIALRVLRELGVLCVSSPPPEPAPQAETAPPPADHVFHRHIPLWSYEDPRYARPLDMPDCPAVFETLDPETPLPQVLQRTRLVALFGAADTPVFRRCLQTPGVFLLLCEPDPARLAAFAACAPAPELARRALILHGEPDAFTPPLADVLPARLFSLGYPVCYALPGFDTGLAGRFAELLEILFYRRRMYELSGQANRRSLPIRPLRRGLFYDQQLHAYTNLTAYATRPDIRPLRGAFAGETAVLVAAGPDLSAQLERIRDLRERAVVIAVNNALKPLVAAGVAPHFVVANDTSVLTAKSWEGLPRLDDVTLVAHCLADLGGDVFGRAHLFDAHLPEIFGRRPTLPLHGSVITTAFSLARYMGCARCVLAGVQLCSPDPWSLRYARGSIHEGPAAPPRPLTGAFPQLVPVTPRNGRALYTSLNFLDAARWLLDKIRISGIPCVNLTRESLILGPGVTFDPAPGVPSTGMLARRLTRLAAAPPPTPRFGPALESARSEIALWRGLSDVVREILSLDGEAFQNAATSTLERFDRTGVSYLAQRFGDFDNARMHALVFGSGEAAQREAGLRYYLENIAAMAAEFLDVLAKQERRLQKLAACA